MSKPAALPSILQMKCPNCRKGSMFKSKSILPFNKMLEMPEKCSHCGQKMELEVGFYYGTGYVSYALSVALFFFNFVWYHLFFGISFRDNSIITYFITSTLIVLVLQPWIMRYSRVLYLWMFVKYGKGNSFKTEEELK